MNKAFSHSLRFRIYFLSLMVFINYIQLYTKLD